MMRGYDILSTMAKAVVIGQIPVPHIGLNKKAPCRGGDKEKSENRGNYAGTF